MQKSPSFDELSVESSCNMSNFYEHCAAIVNFEKVINDRFPGKYRNKKSKRAQLEK